MTTIQAIVIGATQGLTELAPISSLGHGVILPAILGWGTIEKDPSYLPFMVSLHLGTTLALLLYFRQEWRELLTGFFSSSQARRNPDIRDARHVFFLLLVGTVPAGLIGLLLEKKIRHLFSAPMLAAIFLAINGLLLILAEFLKIKGKGKMELREMSFSRGFFIGIFQAVALLPGISRSGITMMGGLVGRLGHEEAARFSFLLSTPIIGAAGVLEVPKLIKYGTPQAMHMALVGGATAFAMAWATTFLLMRYFRHFESSRALAPFGLYCLLAGGASWYFLP
jgi:undecaprenyl-diphosphatase